MGGGGGGRGRKSGVGGRDVDRSPSVKMINCTTFRDAGYSPENADLRRFGLLCLRSALVSCYWWEVHRNDTPMARGRKSEASLTVVALLPGQGRPPAPRDLDRRERRVWRAVVDALPAHWLDPAGQQALRARSPRLSLPSGGRRGCASSGPKARTPLRVPMPWPAAHSAMAEGCGLSSRPAAGHAAVARGFT